jgi:cytochrome P450
MPTHHVNRHADVRAVLGDPRFTVTPPGAGGRPGTLDWLRATAPRFSEGPAHTRRRMISLAQLDRLDPADLRREAAERTRRGLGADVMTLARTIPAAVLGHGLGVADEDALVPAVAMAAAGYLVPQGEPGAADPAVALLAGLLGPGDEEPVAARIALLTQAYEAMANLVARAVVAARHLETRRPVAAIITETLRFAAPVPAMRRVADGTAALAGHVPAAGDLVVLDIAAANRDPSVFTGPDRFDPDRAAIPHLTFGAGRHRCPGAAHALALAEGMAEVLLS